MRERGYTARVAATAAVIALVAVACTGRTAAPSSGVQSTASPASEASIAPAWSDTTDGFTSAPVVDGRSVYVATEEGRLLAYSADCGATCSPDWIGHADSFAVGDQDINWNPASPTVAGGMVYMRSKAPHSVLYAFPTTCGEGTSVCEPAWTARTPTPALDPMRDDLYGIPVVAHGDVYIDTQGEGLVALPSTCVGRCDPLWSKGTDGWPPVIDGGVLYQSTKDRLYALDAGTGALIWKSASAPKGYLSEPTIARRIVFITLRGNRGGAPALYAFPERCSSPCHALWTASVPDLFVDGAVVNGDRVYIGTETGTGTGIGHVYGFPLRCGTNGTACKPVWSVSTSGEIGFFDVTFSGDVAIATSWEQSEMEAFPLDCGNASCDRLWSFQGTDPDHSFYAPTISDGVIYETDRTGRLYALPVDCRTDGGTCEPIWEWASPSTASLMTPAVSSGRLFTSSSDGHVYGFDLPSG